MSSQTLHPALPRIRRLRTTVFVDYCPARAGHIFRCVFFNGNPNVSATQTQTRREDKVRSHSPSVLNQGTTSASITRPPPSSPPQPVFRPLPPIRPSHLPTPCVKARPGFTEVCLFRRVQPTLPSRNPIAGSQLRIPARSAHISIG